MGELFWNKIIGACLASVLVVFSLRVVSEEFFTPHGVEEFAYAIELPTGDEPAVPEDTGPPDFGALLAVADVSAGQTVFEQNCASCHNVGADAADGIGPHMWAVVGRPVASKASYTAYSSALRDGPEVWSYEELYGFLERPARYVPGTTMGFLGLRQQEQRINVIKYLRTLDDELYPLPEPFPVQEEIAVEAAIDEAAEALEGGAAAVEQAIDEAGEAVAEGLQDAVVTDAEAGANVDPGSEETTEDDPDNPV